MHIMPACTSCQHAHHASMHIMPAFTSCTSCTLCQHAHHASMHIMPACTSCQLAHHASLHIMPACTSYQHAHHASMLCVMIAHDATHLSCIATAASERNINCGIIQILDCYQKQFQDSRPNYTTNQGWF